MQASRRTSRTARMDFPGLLEEGSNEISRLWRAEMLAGVTVPAATSAEMPLLLEAVPLVLDQILRFIESEHSKIDAQQICRVVHLNRGKVREHLDVRELLREYHVLREHIFHYLHEHAKQFGTRDSGGRMALYRRVGLAVDQVMRETISAFVEEHTGQLRHLSRTDSLTGLYNHRTFYDRLGEELTRAARYESPLSIVLIDLDNFKSVNDTMGHQFGDYLLVKCAEWLRDQLRQTDVICRYGGDEFGVILPETSGEDAALLMARVASVFRDLSAREGAPASFGMSFGLASHPQDNGTIVRLVKFADMRLLLNKQRHRVDLPTALDSRLIVSN